MQDENENDSEKASPTSDAPRRKPELRDGWYVLPATGRVVTTELIKQIQQQLDDDEVGKANALATGRSVRREA